MPLQRVVPAKVVLRIPGCCDGAGSLHRCGAVAQMELPVSTAMDAWASFLSSDPPALPADPGAEPSLHRNIFQGEVGGAPAAEFFHAQRPSPALNDPMTGAVSALLQPPA